MEKYYNSYPESGGSSPRSREIDFESPTPWEDQNYKVKFMCSYSGKIIPRPHDNQLSYVGGETKILSVDRTIKFPSLISKLSNLCEGDITFKYQLPGEDLDALISVTNDEDLEHMMHEYDRLYRASPKPARLRLFLFPVNQNQSFDSTNEQVNNVDLFGLDKELATHKPSPEPLPVQDLQRLRISEQQAMYKIKSDDNDNHNHNLNVPFSADYYVQKPPEKITPTNIPVTIRPEKQFAGGGFPGSEQPVYMMPGQHGGYHAPIGRPVTGQPGQGYFMQRMQPEVYRDQPVYNVPPQQKPGAVQGFGMAPARPVTTGVMDTGYAQMGYDSPMGRQVYYNAPGGVVQQQYQAMPAYSGDMRTGEVFSQESGKAVQARVSRPL